MKRHQLLEIRRRMHEDFLRRTMGPTWSIYIKRGEAIVQGIVAGGGTLTLRMPRDDLLQPDALHKRGF